MLRTIGHLDVFVVEFDTMPVLPITWTTEEEKPYALALARAIHEGQITEPGKYGIHVDPETKVYNIFKIVE
jgi:hypothetical protein